MKENLKDKRTSLPGYALMLVALAMYVIDHMDILKKEPNGWALLGIGMAGALLIFAPRRFADAIAKAVNGLVDKYLPSK